MMCTILLFKEKNIVIDTIRNNLTFVKNIFYPTMYKNTYHSVVSAHFTDGGLQIASQQFEKSRFAYSVWSYNGHSGIEVHTEIDVLEQWFLVGICEAHAYIR